MSRLLAVSRPREVAWPLWRHEGRVLVAVGPDGRTLASVGADGVLRLADLELGTPTFEVALGGPVSALAATASVVVVGVGTEALLVHAHGGRVLHRVELGAPVAAVAVTPDGAGAAALGGGRIVRVRVATGRATPEPAPDGARTLALAPAVLVGTADGRVLAGGVACDVGAPVVRLRARGAGWVGLLADGRVVDDAGVTLAEGCTALDVDAAGRVGVVGAEGWARHPGAPHRPVDVDVVDLALHPDGVHVALVEADGAVGLVAG